MIKVYKVICESCKLVTEFYKKYIIVKPYKIMGPKIIYKSLFIVYIIKSVVRVKKIK